jgi:sulfate permease, SulP family
VVRRAKPNPSTPDEDPGTLIVDFARSCVVDQSALQAVKDLAAKYDALGKTLQLRHLTRDCHALFLEAGPLMIDSDDDPDDAITADDSVRPRQFGGAH